MQNKKYSRKYYQEYLNKLGKDLDEENFIFYGKKRTGLYGTLMKKWDPIGFEILFQEWCRNKK